MKKNKKLRTEDNFIFSLTKKNELVVIPYQHFNRPWQWCISTVDSSHQIHYFNVIATTLEEAAELGYEAYLKYLKNLKEINKYLNINCEKIEKADEEW